jgi:hypothetical protein
MSSFKAFTRHFLAHNCKVPQIFADDSENDIYLIDFTFLFGFSSFWVQTWICFRGKFRCRLLSNARWFGIGLLKLIAFSKFLARTF